MGISMGWTELALDLSLQRQILAVAVLSMSSLMISFSLGFASPAVPSIEKDPSMRMSIDDASWIASAVPGAALISTLFMGPVVEKVGRKSVMVASSILFFLSWTGIEYASNIDDIVGYRVLCGIAVGAQTVVGSVYQAELIQSNLQSRVAMVPAFIGNIGMLIVLASGKFFDWRGMARFGCYLSIPLLIYFYLPESPYFLISSKRKNSAFKALTWLRASESMAVEEIREQEKNQKSKDVPIVGIAEALAPPHRWGVSVAILLHIGQHATGILAFTLYSSQVFEALGSSLSPNTCSVILQLVNFCGVIFQMIIIVKRGRRKLIHYSSIFIIGSLLALCLYVCLLNLGQATGIFGAKPNILFGLLPILLLSVYQISFNVGWGPVPWLFLVEGLSSQSRSTGTSLAVAANWVSAFLISKSFLYLLESWGIFFLILFFVVLSTLFLAFAHFFMPETENVQVKDINQIYHDSYIRTKIVINSC